MFLSMNLGGVLLVLLAAITEGKENEESTNKRINSNNTIITGRVKLRRTSFDNNHLTKITEDSMIIHHMNDNNLILKEGQQQPIQLRIRRDNHLINQTNIIVSNDNESNFNSNEISWSTINEEVDIVIPIVLYHLQQLGIQHLILPNLKESISVKPFFITYTAGLTLYNGLVYNIAGIVRHGDAMMTYKDKSFLCRFHLLIKSLQFEYDFKIKLMAIDGYGKVLGSLDDTIIYADLYVNVEDTRLRLNDFRIIKFRNIKVHLDHIRLIRELTSVILSPITNLFRDRITTSISDGLKEQMQAFMDDFNDKDPLELRKFTKQMLSSLTGQSKD